MKNDRSLMRSAIDVKQRGAKLTNQTTLLFNKVKFHCVLYMYEFYSNVINPVRAHDNVVPI